MDLQSVLKLLKSVECTEWNKLEINDGEFSLKLERGLENKETVYVSAPSAPVAGAYAPPMAMPAPAAPVAAAPAEAVAPANAPVEATDNAIEISSPLVGIFHKLSDGKNIKIGDKLKKGELLCHVEAMKLMNEITMPEDGEITWIACDEGDAVEYGQMLFKYV